MSLWTNVLNKYVIIIIIIIERRNFGVIMSDDCKDTLQTQNKTVRVRRSRTSKVSIRYRRRQSCRNQENFWWTVPSSADAWMTPVKITMWEMRANCSMLETQHQWNANSLVQTPIGYSLTKVGWKMELMYCVRVCPLLFSFCWFLFRTNTLFGILILWMYRKNLFEDWSSTERISSRFVATCWATRTRRV